MIAYASFFLIVLLGVYMSEKYKCRKRRKERLERGESLEFI